MTQSGMNFIRCGIASGVGPLNNDTMIEKLEQRVGNLEKRIAEHDTQYAVINTKLTAILWGIGVIGTAVIGVLVKFVLNF